jgi:four helix bundle protein
VRTYRDLLVWQRADEVVLEVYRLSESMPSVERFGLMAQMRRAAVSVASNIAEGAGRGSRIDGARMLDIAAGSASELEYQVDLAHRLGYIDTDVDRVLRQIGETRRMLHALISSWRASTGSSPDA